ncbi:MAG: hypothetical protein ACR2GH_18580 [Pseudonocardia sp.]
MAEAATSLRLDDIVHRQHSIHIHWCVDRYHFETSLRYADVDLDDLRVSVDAVTWQRLLFHIALFEMSKGVNLRPRELDLGRWGVFFTPEVAAVWRRVVQGVFAQWRWQRDDADAPVPMAPLRAAPYAPRRRPLGEVSLLAFCGGGKDSLVSAHLLESAELPWGAFVYSNSSYGSHAHQQELIDRLLAHLRPAHVHRLEIDDSFVDSFSAPPGQEVVVAETPTSIMASLPVVLRYGYEHIVLGHERSANKGSFVWERTGEDINHQWGKSREAEVLLSEYVTHALIDSFSYFSILQPVHDPVIFSSLRHRASAAPSTHSCNQSKPWCMKCPKCLYVWLGYSAWLPWRTVDDCFDGINPLVDVTTHDTLAAILGISGHLPFECIGQAAESRLFAHMLRARYPEAADLAVLDSCPPPDAAAVSQLLSVYPEDFGAPGWVASPVLRNLDQEATSARSEISRLLGVTF